MNLLFGLSWTLVHSDAVSDSVDFGSHSGECSSGLSFNAAELSEDDAEGVSEVGLSLVRLDGHILVADSDEQVAISSDVVEANAAVGDAARHAGFNCEDGLFVFVLENESTRAVGLDLLELILGDCAFEGDVLV